MDLTVEEDIARDILESGEPRVVTNVEDNPVHKRGEMKFKSILCVPFLSEEVRLGVMNLGSTTGRSFNLQDLDSLQLLAKYASIALKNLLQFNEMKKTAEELRDVVQEIGRS